MSERCKAIDKDLSRNGSGYYDPTAYKAMKRVEADERKYGRDYERFYNLLNTIFYICELAGFHVEGRIVLTDKKNRKGVEVMGLFEAFMIVGCVISLLNTGNPLYAVATGILFVAMEISLKD